MRRNDPVNLVISGCSSSLFPGSVSGLLVTHHPQSQAVSEGDTLFLECDAKANPPAQYEWYHNMVPMKQHKTRSLKVSVFTESAVNCLRTVWNSDFRKLFLKHKKGGKASQPSQEIYFKKCAIIIKAISHLVSGMRV